MNSEVMYGNSARSSILLYLYCQGILLLTYVIYDFDWKFMLRQEE